MDAPTLLLFLNTVDPAIADEIYQLAENWPDKNPVPPQSNQQFVQTLDLLDTAK